MRKFWDLPAKLVREKDKFILLIFFSAFFCANNSIAQTKFSTLLNSGGLNSDFSVEVQPLRDGYLIAATTIAKAPDTFNYAVQHLSIFKVDFAGNQLWYKKYYIPKFGIGARYITPINDSTFLLTGRIIDYVAYHDSSFARDVLLIKINSKGDTLATKVISLGTGDEVPTGCISTLDNGFAILGQACSISGSNCDHFLIKLDSNLNVEFKGTFSYTNTSFEQPGDLVQLPDSSFYIFGNTQEQPSLERGHLIKLDPHFNVIWQKTYGTDNDRRLGVSLLNMGDTLLLNFVYATQAARSGDAMLVKIDTTGNQISEKKYGRTFSDGFNSVRKLKNGQLIAAGSTTQQIDIRFRAAGWVVKLNPEGDTLFSRIYDFKNIPSIANQNAYFLNCWEEEDGALLLIGTAFALDSNGQEEGQDIWLMRLDSNGCLNENCIFPTGIENIPTEDLVMYPNPASDKLFIKSVHRIEKVIICNLMGQELAQISPEENKVNISMLQTGVYLFYVHTNKGIAVRKIVVQ